MNTTFVRPEESPDYQPAKLIVKLRAPAARPLFGVRPGIMSLATELPFGLSTLARFERMGLIKSVTPLSSKVKLASNEAGPARALASLAATVRPELKERSNAGVSLLELESDANINELRDALSQDPTVEFVSKVPVRYLCVPRRKLKIKVSAASVPSVMWNLTKIKWAEARALPGFVDAKQVKVAVLDTGVDELHPDLSVAGYVYEHPNVAGASGPKDYIGHGTHVSGTIAAQINNKLGISGISQCQLWNWKIFDDEPDYDPYDDLFYYYVDTAMYHKALADCLDEGVSVINLSIGGGGAPDPNERDLFDQLIAGGTTVVAAMGNERTSGSPISYPAAIPGVIAVGATRIDDKIAAFSNRGAHISLSAPGEGIWSTLPTYPGQTGFKARHLPNGKVVTGEPQSRDTNYADWDGTSMASPHVAAAAALLLAKFPGLAPAEVRKRLMDSCDKVPAMGTSAFHPDFGAGRLNLLKLLR